MEDCFCKRCGDLTYPVRWCGCDPRDQVEGHVIDECAPDIEETAP